MNEPDKREPITSNGGLRRDWLVFERGGEPDEETFREVFASAIAVLEESAIRYVLIGGLASAAMGRPRWTHDVDILVEPHNAKEALDALGEAGFDTQETYPDWLFKALKDGVLIDLIFRSAGGLVLDDEMLSRATHREFQGTRTRMIPPEDLIVLKAIVHDEHVPRHWFDALGVIAAGDLDWDYLVERSRHSARRVLSLLIYAESQDLIVPTAVIGRMYRSIYGGGE